MNIIELTRKINAAAISMSFDTRDDIPFVRVIVTYCVDGIQKHIDRLLNQNMVDDPLFDMAKYLKGKMV